MHGKYHTVLSVTFLAALSVQAATAPAAREYRLRFFHTHTGERLDIVYRQGNRYLPEALSALDRYLRDHRTGDVKDYDLKEFDLLHDLMVKLGHPDGEIDIVCGYRTPWSNNYLRQHGHGVAEHSQHMEAKAIDIRIPGVSSAEVRDAEKGEEAEVAPKADSAAESSEERAEEVDAAEEAAPLPPQDIAATADAQRRRWSLPRFRNRRT